MKITFLTQNPDINTGSYRIWINDLSRTIAEVGYESSIIKIQDFSSPNTSVRNNAIKELMSSSVIILGKCCYRLLPEIKKFRGDATYGVINVNSDYRDDLIDFVIVGSAEEYASLSAYRNTFIYPLIERKFENVIPKVHESKDNLRICFHGHYPHLSKFDPHLKNAIEKFSLKTDITLVVITGHPNFNWNIGRPKNVKIETHCYDISMMSNIILSCDIGIVPNICDFSNVLSNFKMESMPDRGWGNTDYFVRFKNKTNAGRAFVFYQHGIPVIHDISPSNFEMMGATKEYLVAHDSDSWIREIEKLRSHDIRNRVSEIYLKKFKENYNPHFWAKALVSKILSIKEL